MAVVVGAVLDRTTSRDSSATLTVATCHHVSCRRLKVAYSLIYGPCITPKRSATTITAVSRPTGSKVQEVVAVDTLPSVMCTGLCSQYWQEVY